MRVVIDSFRDGACITAGACNTKEDNWIESWDDLIMCRKTNTTTRIRTDAL